MEVRQPEVMVRVQLSRSLFWYPLVHLRQILCSHPKTFGFALIVHGLSLSISMSVVSKKAVVPHPPACHRVHPVIAQSSGFEFWKKLSQVSKSTSEGVTISEFWLSKLNWKVLSTLYWLDRVFEGQGLVSYIV